MRMSHITGTKSRNSRLRLFVILILINFIILQDPKYLRDNFNNLEVDTDDVFFNDRQSSNRTPAYLYFIHGYGATNSQFSDMIDFLAEDQSQYYTNKRPFFFDYFSKYLNESYSIDDVHKIDGGISTYASDLFNQLLNTHPQGAKIDIITHSMGGLILREMLRMYHDKLDNEGIIIQKAVTLGTPHLGSNLATHPIKEIVVNFVGRNWQSPVIESISPTSSFILQLNREPGTYMNGIRWFFLAGESNDIINVLGQVVIYNGVSCDGFVDSKSALAMGLDIQEVQRVILPKNHYQLIFDPVNRNSYHYIGEWLQTR